MAEIWPQYSLRPDRRHHAFFRYRHRYTREYIIIIAVHTYYSGWRVSPLCAVNDAEAVMVTTVTGRTVPLPPPLRKVFASNATKTLFAPLIDADAMNSFNKVVDDETHRESDRYRI